MSVKSMTGFGKAEYITDKQRNVTVEIRTLNSKQADINVKLPNVYKEKELEIRNELINRLQRGKIELFVSLDGNAEDMQNRFDETVIKSYYDQLAKIAGDIHAALPVNILSDIIRMPEVIKSERKEVAESEWAKLFDGISAAIDEVNKFRTQEGIALASDMIARIHLIEAGSSNLEKFETQRIETIKNRLYQNLAEYVGENTIDQNRFEQELIYYLEKIDITEERVRLSNHCRYFLATLDENDVIGKKLGFLVQEIGRELNTIGSKANHADIQQIVIKMKDELEKIKEQTSNIL
ncbi:MAG: YicC family protein [Bacteroidales bacterium]|nr:YicC family protein [Bacteroidales bacterium]